MSRIRFLFAIAALTVAASALAACGGGGGSSDASPQSVLDGATLEGVESADLNAKIDVSATGDKGGDIEVTLAGPFESIEGGSTPKLDLTAEASGSMNGKDIEFEGGLVLLPNSAYVGYEGTEYEVDPTTYGFIESALKQAQRQGAQESEAEGTSACRRLFSAAGFPIRSCPSSRTRGSLFGLGPAGTPASACEWTSMKPGDTTRPPASTMVAPVASRCAATAVMVSPLIPTSPANQGFPVPSTTWPPRMTTSKAGGVD